MFVANITILPLVMAQAMLSATDTPPVPPELPAVRTSVRIASRAGRGK